MRKIIIVFLLLTSTNIWAQGHEYEIQTKIDRIYELIAPPLAIKQYSNEIIEDSYTAKRFEAFKLWKSLPVEEQDELSYLFELPGYLGCVESQNYPIKVCYKEEAELSKAQLIVGFAESAWQIEVEEFGFWPPKRGTEETIEQGIDIYIDNAIDTQGAPGYTSMIAYDSSTAISDCSSYIVIDKSEMAESEIRRILNHEFNHACQLAMDCSEVMSSLESTAKWSEQHVVEGDDSAFVYAVSYFQAEPQKSIGWYEYGNAYPYGAALFIEFVMEYIGNNEPQSIAKLWEGTVQNGMTNEPDLFDSILNTAEDNGVDLKTLISQFGEWRYFVGKNDDGAHFKNGSRWFGDELAIQDEFRFNLDSLPKSDDIEIQQLGYYYTEIEIDPQDLPEGKILISGHGSSKSAWDIEAWLLNDNLQKKITTLAEDGNSAEVLIDRADLDSIDRVMFMVANLGKDVDWDQTWRDQPFSYTIDYLLIPEISSITPNQINVGQDAEITINGQNFAPQANVEISGEGIEIISSQIGSSEIKLSLKVSQDAANGKRDVIVKNYELREGYEASIEGGIEIIKPQQPQITGLNPTKGMPGDSILVRVEGSNFSDGVNFEFSCNEISISKIEYVNETTIYLNITISPEAVEKSCDITVKDQYEQSHTLNNGFSIVVEDSDGSGGCSISNNKNSTNVSMILILFLIGCFILKRK